MELENKRCRPCEGGTPSLTEEEIGNYLNALTGWELKDLKISKTYHFVNFKQTMDFVNKVAGLAEEEGHHPDMFVTYGSCKIILWTHAINGLSENDFILAAKIEKLH